jgi:hypothetical protein
MSLDTRASGGVRLLRELWSPPDESGQQGVVEGEAKFARLRSLVRGLLRDDAMQDVRVGLKLRRVFVALGGEELIQILRAVGRGLVVDDPEAGVSGSEWRWARVKAAVEADAAAVRVLGPRGKRELVGGLHMRSEQPRALGIVQRVLEGGEDALREAVDLRGRQPLRAQDGGDARAPGGEESAKGSDELAGCQLLRDPAPA